MIKKFNLYFLTLFSIGKIKYAPGTIASLIACLFSLFFINLFNISVLFLLVLIIFCYSFVAINHSYETFDSEDPQEIVIDEFVGQILPLLAIPIYETLYPIPEIYYFVAAFILFRLFDILKPYPINYVDNNVKGIIGIMLDDVLAGTYSFIVLTLVFFLIGG